MGLWLADAGGRRAMGGRVNGRDYATPHLRLHVHVTVMYCAWMDWCTRSQRVDPTAARVRPVVRASLIGRAG